MPFKKGQSGNPKGRPKIPGELKVAKVVNRFEFERIANKYLYLSREEIMEISRDPKTVGIELIVASVVANAIKHGDQHRLGFLLDRLIGKIPDVVEVSGPNGGPIGLAPALDMRKLIADPESFKALEVLDVSIDEQTKIPSDSK